MADEQNECSTGATEGELQFVSEKVDKVERDLKEELGKISFESLFGRWVSSHVMTVSVSTIATVLGFVGTIFVGSFWVSDRFVEAAELDKATQQIQRDLTKFRHQGSVDNLEMRRWYAEQRLADMESKRSPSADDRARIQQLRREIERLDGQIRATQDKIEKLEKPGQ